MARQNRNEKAEKLVRTLECNGVIFMLQPDGSGFQLRGNEQMFGKLGPEVTDLADEIAAFLHARDVHLDTLLTVPSTETKH